MTSFSDLGKVPVTPLKGLESTTNRRQRRLWRWIAAGLLTLLLLVLIYLTQRGTISSDFLLGYLAFLIGGMVGAGELIARYRDSPFGSLGRNPSFVYLAVNAVAAATAFFLIDIFGWEFGFISENPAASGAIQVLVAGFGAMALFRSSLFTARIGEQEVGVGPSIVLQTVLNAADSGVDRESAKARAQTVKTIMRCVDADKAKNVLPGFCQRLLQSSLPETEFTVVKNKVKEIFEKEGSIATAPNGERVPEEVAENSKAYLLGLTLMNYMGPDALEAAVEALGSEIKKAPILHLTDIAKEIDDAQGNEVDVHYQVWAEDAEGNPIEDAEGRPQVTCNPPSGSKFPVGKTTIVSCQVTDEKTKQKAEGSFKVTLCRRVKLPQDVASVKDVALVENGNGDASFGE